MDDRQARAQAERVETLLASLEGLPDPVARQTATAAVQAIVDLYGEGLARIMAHLAGADGAVIRDAVARDELVGNLLLVHGLHPSDVEARARGALDTLAERLASHGARAELAGVDGGVARVRLYGKNGGCGSSTETLRRTIQESLMAVAPELDDVDVEHVVPPTLLQIGVRPSAAAMSRATS